MYRVLKSQKVERFLGKLDGHIKTRIEERLKRLGKDPVPTDAKFIGRDNEGNKIFRYRAGGYRILYKVKIKEKIVLIAKIGKRPNVYAKF
ncbi:MAG: type II toxin-antitoxin system RelE/ParE family toxin [Thermodesulfobacteriota bacterium]